MNYILKYLATNVLVAFCFCVKDHDQSKGWGLFGFTLKSWSITEGRQAGVQGRSHRGTWLADLLNNSLIGSRLTSFLNSPGLWGMRNGVAHSGLCPCTSVNDQDDSSQVLTIKADQDSRSNTVIKINFTNCYMWLLNILYFLCLVPFFPASAEDRAQSCARQGHTLTYIPRPCFLLQGLSGSG